MIINPSEYTRLFQVQAKNQVLFLDMVMEAYELLDGLIVVRNEEFTFYLPSQMIKETTTMGHELYESEKAFSAYESAFLDFLFKADAFRLFIAIKEALTEDDLSTIQSFIKTFFLHYSKTEFFYTDSVYQKAQQGDDQGTLDRLQREDRLKYKGREILNQLFFLRDNLVHHVARILAKQCAVRGEDVLLSTVEEVRGLLRGALVSPNLGERNEMYVLMAVDRKRVTLTSAAQREIAQAFCEVPSSRAILKGAVACAGKAIGMVKVFPPLYGDMERLMKEVENMKQGQIMVAETTSPDIVLACRKASAIITNQGGLMSHAAVVSREMGIPCIVGTGNATKVLKDGDLIEVDADAGIVRHIDNVTT